MSTVNLIPLPLEYVSCQYPRHTHTSMALNGHYNVNIPNNYLSNAQVNKTIKTKYLANGHKHVGTSGA